MALTDEFDLSTPWGRTKFARKSAGFKSQADMASKLNMERPAYARYETERVITSEALPKFCEATGINPIWLLTGDGEMITPLTQSKEAEVLKYLREKSAEYAEDPFKSPFLKGAIKIIEDESEGK